MIPSLSVKGHQCVVSAYTRQGRVLHLVSLIGIRESVRAALAAMQHGHSAVLKTNETTLVNLGYQSVKVIQGRLPNGAFHAVAIGEGIKNGDILILKDGMPLAERFYRYLITKSTLPLHSSWQERLLMLAETNGMITKLATHDIEAYIFDKPIGTFEALIRHALVNRELPEIGVTPCV